MSYNQQLILMISMQPKTPTPKDQSNESKTLFVGNLSFQVEQADVYVNVTILCYNFGFDFYFSTVYLLVICGLCM